MKELLKYLSSNPLEYFIIFNDKFEIIRRSDNLNLVKSNNLKSFIWLEDFERFEIFVKNIKREKWITGIFEISVNEKNYHKVNILATTFEGNNLIFWGIPQKSENTKKIEKSLLERTITEFYPITEIFLDKYYRVIKVLQNNMFFNDSSNNLTNNSFLEFINYQDLNEFKIFHEKIVQLDKIYKLNYRIKNHMEEEIWVEEYCQLRKDEEGTYYHCLIKNIDEEYRYRQNLIVERDQALQLANHLEKTREQERKNMAREIHDEIGHALTSLKLDMNLLLKKRFMREDMLIVRLNEMMKQIEQTIKTVQHISAQLRPSILDHFGLIAAIEWQAKEFQRQTTIRCRYSLPDEDIEIPETKTIAIFRIFQEILTNIARHSQATRVDINLTIENNIMELQVSDNGIGIKKEYINSPTSLGLIGMQERAKLIGGKLSINSVINVGTTITLTVAIN